MKQSKELFVVRKMLPDAQNSNTYKMNIEANEKELLKFFTDFINFTCLSTMPAKCFTLTFCMSFITFTTSDFNFMD